MATAGGKRVGAGRPKAGTTPAPKPVVTKTKTQHQPKAPLLTQKGKAELTERLMDKVLAMNISPLEVMLNTMKLHYDQGQEALSLRETVEDADKRAYLMRLAQAEMGSSSSVAEKVAPYLHPKLQTTTLKGDEKNPLQLGVNLRNLSDTELKTMETIMAKVNADDKP